MDTKKPLLVGAPVVFLDAKRQPHNALVTAWHGCKDGDTIEDFRAKYGADTMPCINVVFVVGDESKTDPYGRQIERNTSVMHGSRQSPPNLGMCFLFPDEV